MSVEAFQGQAPVFIVDSIDPSAGGWFNADPFGRTSPSDALSADVSRSDGTPPSGGDIDGTLAPDGGDDDMERRLQHLVGLEQIREMAKALAAHEYGAHPDLYAFAAEKAARIVDDIEDFFGDGTGMEAPRITEGLTMLFFAFTDANDHTDTLSTELIDAEIAESWEPGLGGNRGATYAELAQSMLVWGAHMYLFAWSMGREGELLEATTADGRYALVMARIEYIATDDPQAE